MIRDYRTDHEALVVEKGTKYGELVRMLYMCRYYNYSLFI